MKKDTFWLWGTLLGLLGIFSLVILIGSGTFDPLVAFSRRLDQVAINISFPLLIGGGVTISGIVIGFVAEIGRDTFERPKFSWKRILIYCLVSVILGVLVFSFL